MDKYGMQQFKKNEAIGSKRKGRGLATRTELPVTESRAARTPLSVRGVASRQRTTPERGW